MHLWMVLRPFFSIRPLADRHPFRHLEPAENHVDRAAGADVAPFRSGPFKAPEEDEHVTGTDVVVFKVLFRRTFLAEQRTPAPQPWQSVSGEIRVQVSTMSGRSACQILHQFTHGRMLVPGNVLVGYWRCLVRDRKRNHRAVREDWTWLSASGRIESFAAENDLHLVPQETGFQDLSFSGQWIGGAWMPNLDWPTNRRNSAFTSSENRHLWPLPTAS